MKYLEYMTLLCIAHKLGCFDFGVVVLLMISGLILDALAPKKRASVCVSLPPELFEDMGRLYGNKEDKEDE